MPKYPINKKIILKNIQLTAGNNITFLSTKETLPWKQEGENVEIILPEYHPDKIKSPYAYAIKIENYGKFVTKPVVNVVYDKSLKPVVNITSSTPVTEIYYTTNGTEPTTQSIKYLKPFTVTATSVIKVIAVKEGLMQSSTAELAVRTYTLMKPVNAFKLSAGLSYKYFEDDAMSIAKTAMLQPVKSGIVNNFNTDNKNRAEKYGFVFEGFIKIDKKGLYDFYTNSDDGSMLYIDDELVINNDGNHGMEEKTDKAFLDKGMHKIKVVYYDAGGNNGLIVSYNLKEQRKIVIPVTVLYH